jgi:glycosyltransferase involved in cell wall biosynthesis
MAPSEVVVFDDASDDGTEDVVRDFASTTTVQIVLCQQPKNRGLVGNFESAIHATTGDIVFLSDQDDVWYPQKISKVVEAFDRGPTIGLVFSDADLVGSDLSPMGRTLWQSIRFNQAEKGQIRSPHAFDLLLRRFLVTGATIAFRRSLISSCLPLSTHLIHDAWIALAISAISRIDFIDEPLIQYRQHAAQQIGERESWRNWLTQCQAAKKMSPSYLNEQRLFFRDLASRLDKAKASWVHPNVGDLAMRKILHLDHRIAIRAGSPRSIAKIVREYAAGEYSTFSYGWKSAAQDIFL